MSLRQIGPIALAGTDHGDPSFTWASDPGADGTRDASVGGQLLWPQAQQLGELVNNPERRQTVGKVTGVLEPLWFDDALLGAWSGWFLLVSASVSPAQVHSLAGLSGYVPFSLKCAHLGTRMPAVAASSRPLVNDFSLGPQSVLVPPLYAENPAGDGGWLVAVGGTWSYREYEDVY
jgi:hypothetical protein